MRANMRSTRGSLLLGSRHPGKESRTAGSFLGALFSAGFWWNLGLRQFDRKASTKSPKRVQEEKMHDTIPRRACQTGRQLSGFVRGDRIAVVFQTPYRWYPRSPRSCAGSDRIVVTGDAGSPKRKSGPPYPSPRRAGSSTPTVASGSCRRIRDKRSIRKSSRPALDVCLSQRVAWPDTRRSLWDCIMGR